MPDIVLDNVILNPNLIPLENYVPPNLGHCPSCDYIIFPVDTPWRHESNMDYLATHDIRYSTHNTHTWAPTQLTGEVGNTYYHIWCTRKCDLCQNIVPKNTIYVYENRNLCTPCTEAYLEEHTDCEMFECNNCETITCEEYAVFSEYINDYLCKNCSDTRIYACENCDYSGTHIDIENHSCDDYMSMSRMVSSYVHSYGYKPRPTFFGKDTFFLGVELEVEQVEEDDDLYVEGVEELFDTIGNQAYLKEDGSLSEYGVEIVTHPLSLDYHQNVFNWADITRKLKRKGFRSWNTDNCGLHIHVCKPNAYKDESHRIRFMKLIYDNEIQVKALAGRSSIEYASFSDKGNIVRKVKYDDQSNNRYSAINVDNDNTDEIRVFRGSLRPERILSAIELVHASIEYTRNMKIVPKNKPLSWVRFVSYVSDKSETYPNLFTIMNEVFKKEEQGGND